MAGRLKIAHVIFRLDYGGLENGLVNLINRLPAERFEHLVIALTVATSFRCRLPPGVRVVELHKPPGKGLRYLQALRRLLMTERVDILHTRNLACLESQLAGYLAGVRLRIHGEHGWDVVDLEGRNWKYRALRRVFRLLVSRYVVVSAHLGEYLRHEIHVPPSRIVHIANGVATDKFTPRSNRQGIQQPLRLGSVGRMEAVKDYMTLAEAFRSLSERYPGRLRLEIIGDGSQRSRVAEYLRSAGLGDSVNLPGFRDDIADCMRRFDLFILPSLGEGISNTILEAMSCGLPVIATDVGGNRELVVDGVTGRLVPPRKPVELAEAIAAYVEDGSLRAAQGRAGRRRAESEFSVPVMVERYRQLYEQLAAAN